jgi:transcriptional regulator NrdR family protein
MSAGDGIRCPSCGSDTSVCETRQNRGSLRRRRRCLRAECKGRLTTIEMPVPAYSKRVLTTELDMVLVPTSMEMVPRDLMRMLRKFVQVYDIQVEAPEEHW